MSKLGEIAAVGAACLAACLLVESAPATAQEAELDEQLRLFAR
jgi:hypothetical protein